MRFDEVIKKYGYPIASKRVSSYAETARRNPCSQRARWLRGDDRTKFVSPKWWPLVNADFWVSDKCCTVMKKTPFKQFEKATGKKPIIGTMASEGLNREIEWTKNGCNAFNVPCPSSRPISFWAEQDVLQYIKENNLKIASVYGEIVSMDDEGYEYSEELVPGGKLYTTGCNRTGCIFAHLVATLRKSRHDSSA